MQTADSWVRPLVAKYPLETLRLLTLLCEAGLRRGETSANDLDSQEYTHPKVVGGTFKVLKRVGFTPSGRIIPATRPRSNGRPVQVWTLTDGSRVEEFLRECRVVVLRQEAKEAAPLVQAVLAV